MALSSKFLDGDASNKIILVAILLHQASSKVVLSPCFGMRICPRLQRVHVVFATANHVQMHAARINTVHFPITTRKDITPNGMGSDGSWIVRRTAISVRVIMTRMVGGTIVVRIGAVITAVVGRRLLDRIHSR